jgi:hypothetical protein
VVVLADQIQVEGEARSQRSVDHVGIVPARSGLYLELDQVDPSIRPECNGCIFCRLHGPPSTSIFV